MPENGYQNTKITIFISSVMASIDEKSLQAFTELILERMKGISSDWKKPWIASSGKTGLPQNLNGRLYNGINIFMLYLLTELRQYNLPVYLTFNQARNEGLLINKDAKSFPVVYWNITVKDRETGKTIPLEKYNALPASEKEKYKTIPYMKHYNVFNVDQTNLKEIKPEVYEALENKLSPKKKLDDRGMFTYPPLDKMVDKNLWIVPIKPTYQDKAYYSSASNSIVVPLKAQFQDGESYYSTMLHEMAHSTGKPLKREMGTILGIDKYGREELVAELTSAITLQNIGVASTIRESNVQYLKGWLHNIKEEPNFLFNVLSDVGKASGMIQQEIDKVILLEQEKVQDISGQKNETVMDTGTVPAPGMKIDKEFETALNSAKQGAFQPLIDLKGKGFQPDEKQIEKLKTALDSKGRTIAGTIFQISIEPKPVVKPVVTENKNTVKQLTLNF